MTISKKVVSSALSKTSISILTPAFRPEAAYLHGSDDRREFTSTGWSFELAHKIGCGPFTGFIGYKGHYVTADNGLDSFSNHEIFLGFRVFFGTASIRDNEMRGAGLTLPDFSTPIGIGAELD